MTAPTTPSPTEPSYGDLLASSHAWIDIATIRDCGPYPDPRSAHQAVDGYQRLLATAGRHLRLFVEPGFPEALSQTPSADAIVELEHRWTRLNLPEVTDTAWSRAADQLGIAHDLLATHIGAYGQALSPDAELLLTPEVRSVAAHRMLEQLAPAVTACGRVLDNARAARRRSHPGPTKAQIGALRALQPRMQQLLTDASRDYPADSHVADLQLLDKVGLARHDLARTRRPIDFESSLVALRVLRQVSFRQANGAEHIGVGTLHDLTRLATATIAKVRATFVEPDTPLARVRHAMTLDALDRADAAWVDVSKTVGPQVRGLEREPRVFADAARMIAVSEAGDSTLARAVLTSLPRLASQSAEAIQRLADSDGLVIYARQPARLSPTWRPVNQAESDRLVQSLATATAATLQLDETIAARDIRSAVTEESLRRGDTPRQSRQVAATQSAPKR